jgi:hypothetical protein
MSNIAKKEEGEPMTMTKPKRESRENQSGSSKGD